MTSGKKRWWSLSGWTPSRWTPNFWTWGLTLLLGLSLATTGWSQGTKTAPKAGAPKTGTAKPGVTRPGTTKPGTRPGTKKPVTPAEKMKNAAPGGVLPKPTLTLILKSYSEADTDVLHLFKLANAPQQAKTLKETFSLFTEGIDTSRPIFVQSFEPGSLKYLRSKGLNTRLIQLIDADEGEIVADSINMPIPHREFQRMARYGKAGQKAVLILYRSHHRSEPVAPSLS